MKIKHDAQADAIYVHLDAKPYHYGKDLDDRRRIDYSEDDTPIKVELLYAGKGINISGLPDEQEIARLLEARGLRFTL